MLSVLGQRKEPQLPCQWMHLQEKAWQEGDKNRFGGFPPWDYKNDSFKSDSREVHCQQQTKTTVLP